MADRRVGPSYWKLSPTKRRTPAVLRRAGGEEEAASPPVLSLSHFCKSPFLSFGEVRLGASRTLSLALDNPNQEVAEVKISRFPAADQGFSIAQRSFVLQPKEKTVISVNWTPLKEGRVREIVTFVVNNTLKHQAILLGNAEKWKKKKRSLWDTINKTVSNSSSHKKRISNSQDVDKTFDVSQRVDTVKSPLQACENLAVTEVCSPTEKNSLTLEENRIPISPISPCFRECCGETCLSTSVRRSTTYSSLLASENLQLLRVEGSTILKDFDEQVLTETSFHCMNNIDDQTKENNRCILTPSCSSALNITQSKGNFLSTDSFVHNSHVANNEVELVTGLSSGKFMKDNSKPTHLESKIVHEIYQTILRPDSFVNDNYGLNQDLESETIKPILSPNQFVKDNMAFMCTSQQTYNLSPSSNENSQGPQPPQDWRKNKALPRTHGCQDSKSPKAIFEQPKTIEMKPNDYSFTKQNHPKFSAFQDISSYSQNKQSKRRPILSTTVTKRKSSCARVKQTETNKSMAKRCLNTAVGELGKVLVDNQKEKKSFHSYLPIIDPIVSKFNSHKNEITPCSSKTALAAHKRKSAGNMENANVRGTVVEATEVQVIKRIHYSPVESKSSAVKKNKEVHRTHLKTYE
ncbi:LOW QUALITY PROTEIN: abnormal spindle-like microcephaly-associated protein [Elephas maximus indicus]|uniref:LOW QUALITY PROTEIN: abnormal spindle-like microcephaly-associated protein n=1 Tax=Elephas maximus indicus TaxID=99487 RepID=UPI0021167B32|nr:LOW QUALITY PROTEIN: abnormal spindle-like microcephaly-associated protein [Elephas maximus indicus]